MNIKLYRIIFVIIVTIFVTELRNIYKNDRGDKNNAGRASEFILYMADTNTV